MKFAVAYMLPLLAEASVMAGIPARKSNSLSIYSTFPYVPFHRVERACAQANGPTAQDCHRHDKGRAKT
jgi:hypothetical protein